MFTSPKDQWVTGIKIHWIRKIILETSTTTLHKSITISNYVYISKWPVSNRYKKYTELEKSVIILPFFVTGCARFFLTMSCAFNDKNSLAKHAIHAAYLVIIHQLIRFISSKLNIKLWTPGTELLDNKAKDILTEEAFRKLHHWNRNVYILKNFP